MKGLGNHRPATKEGKQFLVTKHRGIVGFMGVSMFLSICSLAGTHASASTEKDSAALKGRCEYNAAPVGGLPGFALCRYVVITRDGKNSSVVYLDHREQLSVRFDGEFTGDEMTVRRMQASGYDQREAEGKCWFSYRDGRTHWVSCAAKSPAPDHTTYAANFRNRGW